MNTRENPRKFSQNRTPNKRSLRLERKKHFGAVKIEIELRFPIWILYHEHKFFFRIVVLAPRICKSLFQIARYFSRRPTLQMDN